MLRSVAREHLLSCKIIPISLRSMEDLPFIINMIFTYTKQTYWSSDATNENQIGLFFRLHLPPVASSMTEAEADISDAATLF